MAPAGQRLLHGRSRFGEVDAGSRIFRSKHLSLDNRVGSAPGVRVRHGGAGTTAASVRSGVPTLILWIGADEPVWATQIKRLGVGTSRRLSATTRKTLHDDLRTVLGAVCVA
ncbi:glycosyltransferase [Bradyrhizobium liaoningense]|uniref:glycosyltransferase n=1 Tax=Bradyrhizobium liaoningense TaxID=43992 RepID=UPI003D9B318F